MNSMLQRHYLWTDIKKRFEYWVPNSIKYSYYDLDPVTGHMGPAVISVHKNDTLDFPIINNIENPLILIFADDENPGGCVNSGNGM